MTEALIPAIPPRRSYAHVVRAITGRPWAIEARTGRQIVGIVNARLSGERIAVLEPLTAEAELAADIAAATEGWHGDATGGRLVGSVAVIPVHGVISHRMSMMDEMCASGASCEAIRHDVQSALEDPNVKAVVLEFDSPGGSVDGVMELATWLRQARAAYPGKSITAHANTLCASAALWIATSCSEVVITPSGEIGSLGVYAIHEDDSGALEMAGVHISYIHAGDYKVELASTAPLSDDARAHVQGQVDATYRQFVADVAAGMDTSADKVVADFGQGRTLLAKEAKAAGMVDLIETLDATVDRLNKRPASGARRVRPSGRAAEEIAPAADAGLPTTRTAEAHAPAQPAAPAAATTPTRADREWNRRMQRQNRSIR